MSDRLDRALPHLRATLRRAPTFLGALALLSLAFGCDPSRTTTKLPNPSTSAAPPASSLQPPASPTQPRTLALPAEAGPGVWRVAWDAAESTYGLLHHERAGTHTFSLWRLAGAGGAAELAGHRLDEGPLQPHLVPLLDGGESRWIWQLVRDDTAPGMLLWWTLEGRAEGFGEPHATSFEGHPPLGDSVTVGLEGGQRLVCYSVAPEGPSSPRVHLSERPGRGLACGTLAEDHRWASAPRWVSVEDDGGRWASPWLAQGEPAYLIALHDAGEGWRWVGRWLHEGAPWLDLGGEPLDEEPSAPVPRPQGAVYARVLGAQGVAVALPGRGAWAPRAGWVGPDGSQRGERRQFPAWPRLEPPLWVQAGERAALVLASVGLSGERTVVLFAPDVDAPVVLDLVVPLEARGRLHSWAGAVTGMVLVTMEEDGLRWLEVTDEARWVPQALEGE